MQLDISYINNKKPILEQSDWCIFKAVKIYLKKQGST